MLFGSDYDASTCRIKGFTSIAKTCISYDEYTEVTWFGSRNACSEKGGRLLEITSEQSQNALRAALPCNQAAFWIGATKVNWKWTNGKKIISANFDVENPPREKVVEICTLTAYEIRRRP